MSTRTFSRAFFFLTCGLSWGSDHVTLIGLSGVAESAEFDVGQRRDSGVVKSFRRRMTSFCQFVDVVLNEFEIRMWQIRILFPRGETCVSFVFQQTVCHLTVEVNVKVSYGRDNLWLSQVNLDPDTLDDMVSDRLLISVVVSPVLRTRTHLHGWTRLRKRWGLSEDEWVLCQCERTP